MGLFGNFNFRISLLASASAAAGDLGVGGRRPAAGAANLCDGGFQECTGLEVEMDVQELVEGGRNDGVIRRVGRGKYQNLVLKRGMFFGTGSGGGAAGLDDRVWQWLQGILTGQRPVRRYDGVIQVLNNVGARTGGPELVLATWTFDRGLPAKVGGPQLNAKTGDIAIEELTIAHEGLRLAAGQGP
jgi:phage tail-like protein